MLSRRPNQVVINKRKRTCCLVDFAIPADHYVKIKENEKKDKYLDLARKLKKKTVKYEDNSDTNCRWCRMVPKVLERRLKDLEIKGKIETILTTVLLKSARILRKVL